jgi:hypothetical protein
MSRILVCLLVAVTAACGAPSDAAPDADVLSVEPDAGSEPSKADGAGGQTEIKFTIRPDQHPRAVRVLGLTAVKAQHRDISFYDDGRLTLFSKGLILRTRKVSGGTDDSTVKVRPLVAGDVDKAWFGLDGFKCEEDRAGTKSVESCSLTTSQKDGEIDDVAAGVRSIDKLFSGDQETFAATCGLKTLPWSDLLPLGPIDAQAWKVAVKGVEPKLAVEIWTLPDETELLEVSVRVARADAARTALSLAAFLQRKGLSTAVPQETKTRLALEYFAGLKR